MKPSSPDMKFAQCAVGSAARVWLVAEEDDQFRLLQLKEEKWAARSPAWDISSVCGVDHGGGRYEVIALGAEGELLMGAPGGFAETHIDPVGKGPQQYGVLREIRRVGDDVFAVGMSRQAYRRRRGVWREVAGSIRSSGPAAIGFNSLHGHSSKAVFAVGLGGEIWAYNGSTWRQLESPTSLALQRVMALKSGHILACGAGGAILQGRPDALTLVKNDLTKDAFYGMVEFRGRVFVSSLTSLFVLGPRGLEAVDVGLKRPLTFGDLDADDEVVWSVGARHLLRSIDGVTWQQVTCPL